MKEKNIRLLKGKPLLAYTVEQAFKCSFLNDVVVSTDNTLIKNAAQTAGINYVIDRPPELATDEASKWEVFIHAVETYENEKKVNVDYLVDMDVTVPLKTSCDVTGAIELALQNPEADVIITAYEPERNPYFNMMEAGRDGYAYIVKQSSQPIVRRQDAPRVYGLTPAVYVIRKSALYSYSHWSQAKCKIYVIPRERAVDVDTEFDFRMVEFLMENK